MTEDARTVTLKLLSALPQGATACPSEVARALAEAAATSDWRSRMPAVHAAIDRLLAEGLVGLSWKGKPKARRDGPYRIHIA